MKKKLTSLAVFLMAFMLSVIGLMPGSTAHAAEGAGGENVPSLDDQGRYDLTNDVEAQNPFPDVFSEEELQQSEQGKNAPLFTRKVFFTPEGEGQEPRVFDMATNPPHPQQAGHFDAYYVIRPVPKSAGHTLVAYGLLTRRNEVNPDGSISFDKEIRNYNSTKVWINGMDPIEIPTGDLNGSRVNVFFDTLDHRKYVHIRYELTEQDEYFNASTQLWGSSAQFDLFEANIKANAEFHYVDDFAYQRQLGRDIAQMSIPERSAGESDRYSAKPTVKLELEDLAPSEVTDAVKFSPAREKYKAAKDYRTPLLSPDGTADKLTMASLTSTEIPGYVYVSNDIDKPETGAFLDDAATKEADGNHYFAYAYDANGNRQLTKHYYLTYRMLPTELVVEQFKGDEGEKLDGAKFDLYRVDGETETLVAKNIPVNTGRADAAETTRAELGDIARQEVSMTDGLYYAGDAVYLNPGTYRIKQTANEKGYALAEPRDFTIGALTDPDAKTRKVLTFRAEPVQPAQPSQPTEPVQPSQPAQPAPQIANTGAAESLPYQLAVASFAALAGAALVGRGRSGSRR